MALAVNVGHVATQATTGTDISPMSSTINIQMNMPEAESIHSSINLGLSEIDLDVVQSDHDPQSLNHVVGSQDVSIVDASAISNADVIEKSTGLNLVTPGAVERWDSTFEINDQLTISNDLAARLEDNTASTPVLPVSCTSTLIPTASASPDPPSAPLSELHSSMFPPMASGIAPPSPTPVSVNNLPMESQMAHGLNCTPNSVAILPQISALLPTASTTMIDLHVSQTPHDGQSANVASIPSPIPLLQTSTQTGLPVPSLLTSPMALPTASQRAVNSAVTQVSPSTSDINQVDGSTDEGGRATAPMKKPAKMQHGTSNTAW
ncbi:hypothetical protein L208DRAFT_1379347 [Tricholoma matsutake]|nr:hypothetical protein L208DRAFT_1379347 [Tricholoma matsutake 945]